MEADTSPRMPRGPRRSAQIPEGSLVALPARSPREAQPRYAFVGPDQKYFDTTTKTWQELPGDAARMRKMSVAHACWHALAPEDRSAILARVAGLNLRMVTWQRRREERQRLRSSRPPCRRLFVSSEAPVPAQSG